MIHAFTPESSQKLIAYTTIVVFPLCFAINAAEFTVGFPT